jgi:hypothetical protein
MVREKERRGHLDHLIQGRKARVSWKIGSSLLITIVERNNSKIRNSRKAQKICL